MNAGILKKSTFQCIHFIEESELQEVLEASSGLLAREFSAAKIKSQKDLLAAIAVALAFPDYFGHNLDALDECLQDLEWLPATGYVFFVKNATSLWRRNSRLAAVLVDVWLTAAEHWNETNVPFHLVFVW